MGGMEGSMGHSGKELHVQDHEDAQQNLVLRNFMPLCKRPLLFQRVEDP